MVVDAVSDNIYPSTSASRGMIVNTGQFPDVDEAQDFSYVLPSTPTSSHSPSKDYVYPVQCFFTLPDPHSGLAMLSATPNFDLCKGSGLSTEQQTVISGSQITQIYNCRVIRGHALDFDEVWFQNGRIINPALLYGLRGPDVRIDAQGLIVAPGLVDVQLNGAFGYDFSFNLDDIDKCLNAVSRGILLQGCTSFCPTVVSSTSKTYHTVLPHIGRRPGSLRNGAESLGAHVEGPFMNPKKKGAHEQACLRAAPNGLADFDECYGLDNLREHVCYMTLAPELDGVLGAIPNLINQCGIVVSQGHSAASHETALQAHRSGAKMITHLFNAMTSFHHRDPGIVGLLGGAENNYSTKHKPNNSLYDSDASLSSRAFYGLICDGIHVHSNAVKIAYNSHPAGAILVTDAMGAMGLPDGQYKLGNMTVDVGPLADMKDNTRAAVIQGTSTLAGSIITLIECVRKFKEFTQCSLVEAIEAATLHPAQMLGIEHRKGTLEYGADADIIFLTDDLQVERVFVRGELATPETVGN